MQFKSLHHENGSHILVQVLWTLVDVAVWFVTQWPTGTGLDMEAQGHKRRFVPVDCVARPVDRAHVCCFQRLLPIGWDCGSVVTN